MMLSCYTHKNLISLLGFCDEDGEKIIVYEHASNGSLDRHLSSTALTWTQRLKICLDVARGLTYLHDHKGTQQRVLHRDIKSANILLDDNWNAKLADMGLSKIGPANQRHTFLFTNVVGTPGYCDPQYMVTYTLTKESDIYSFGVVLFEVLCGRLCFQWANDQLEIFVRMWKQSYKHKKLEQIIFKDITPPMDPNSLKAFSEIAFQCLHDSREQRPPISLIVEKLEIALKLQEGREMKQDNAVGTSQTYLNVNFSKGKGLFLGKKKKKTSSWQAYVDDHLLCEIEGNHLSAAAIIGHDGTVWAQSPTFPQVKPEEITGIMNDFNEPGSLAPTGFYLGGTKYMVIQGEAGAVIRGKRGPGGVTIKKTTMSLIIGIYDEPTTPGQCNMIVERLGDYLLEQGF